MHLLNIKGTEFQNLIQFPCVFYNPTFYLHPVSLLHKLKRAAPENKEITLRVKDEVTAWKLINSFQEYVDYTEHMAPHDIIYVYSVSFPVIYSFEEGVNFILDTQGDSLLYVQENNYLVDITGVTDWISFLRTLRDTYNSSVASGSPLATPNLVSLGKMFSHARLLRDNTKLLDKRHYC